MYACVFVYASLVSKFQLSPLTGTTTSHALLDWMYMIH